MPVTLEEVKAAIRTKYGTGFIPHHECGICNSMVGYYQQDDKYTLWFDPSCDCSFGGGGGRYTDFSEIVEFINMQTTPTAINHLRALYGLDER